MKPRTFSDEVLDDRTAQVLSGKTPSERLAMASRLWVYARNLMRNAIRSEHPEWSNEQIQREAARRIADGAH